MSRHSWIDQAACVGVPDEVLFPAGLRRPARGLYKDARAVCEPCPVKAECLEDALATEHGTHHYRHGIRGGLIPYERANLDLARRKAAAAEAAAAGEQP